MYRILVHVAEQTSCGYYRAVLPVLHMANPLRERGIEVVATNKLDESDLYDCYVFGRVPAPAEYIFARRLRERGVKIVWDLDDDFFTIPDWSPVKELFGPVPLNYLDSAIEMADAITVSTGRLREATTERWPGMPVHVLENLVDIRTYINVKSNSDLTRILWTGSKTHAGDIDPLYAVADFVGKTPGYLLIVYGELPDRLVNRKNVIQVPWGAKRNYESIISLIAPDVALLPLIDCPFNRCKSAIKFYECATAGAMCIASNVPPFSDVIEDSITGLLLPHDDHEAWLTEIEAAHSEETSIDVSEIKLNARREVADEFAWNSDNRRKRAWLDFYAGLPDL